MELSHLKYVIVRIRYFDAQMLDSFPVNFSIQALNRVCWSKVTLASFHWNVHRLFFLLPNTEVGEEYSRGETRLVRGSKTTQGTSLKQ